MSKRDLSRLNQQEAAELAGVTARAFRDWVGCPRNSDGTYSGPQVVAWLLRRAGGEGDFDDQRERLAAAQADKFEMENALRRGQLADLKDVERFVGACIAAARAKFLGMDTKLSPQLVNIGDPNVIAAAIRAEIYAGLAELAAYQPKVDASEPSRGDQAGDASVGTTAKPDRQPVGRRQPKTQQRKQRRARRLAD